MPEEISKPKVKKNTTGKNVGMAALCYLGALILIPLLTGAKDDPFVKFHIKQGIVLLIAFIIFSLVRHVILFGWLIGLFVLILLIIGLINALNGKKEELPLIGQFGSRINV